MVNIEPHHRRIRNKAKAIHLGLIPLALAVPLLWIYFAYGPCQEAESGAMLTLCHALTFVPLLPALAGLLAGGFIIWDLRRLGAAKHAERGGKPRSHWDHASEGYRAIDHHHRRHVHFALAQIVLVGLALVAWLAIIAYQSTH